MLLLEVLARQCFCQGFKDTSDPRIQGIHRTMAKVTWHTVGDDEWDGYVWIRSGLPIGLLSGSRWDFLWFLPTILVYFLGGAHNEGDYFSCSKPSEYSSRK